MGRAIAAALLGLAPLCGSGCADARSTPGEVHFTVRGRWDDAPTIRWRIEEAEGPLATSVVREAVRSAAREWSEAGEVTFASAEDEEPDVTLGWRSGAHEACPSFGSDSRVAHSGPVEPGTFVHLDADREWSEASLRRAVLHELGHVLGLGHSEDPRAVMYAETEPPRDVLGDSDRAGLASLYGGWTDGPGDVRVGGSDAPVLRRIAPPGVSEVAVFDMDGDGDDELVVWRTDRAGHGAVTAYHFTEGPRLAATVGPALGMVAPEARVVLGTTRGGERVLVSIYPNGRLVLRQLDAQGRFEPWPPSKPFRLESGVVDEDGDGLLDEGAVVTEPTEPVRADLDGDGRVDVVAREPG